MENISNEYNAEALTEPMLNVLAPFIVNEIENIVPFEEINDEEREKILKVAMQSCEISTIVLLKLLEKNELKLDRLAVHLENIKQNQFDELIKLLK